MSCKNIFLFENSDAEKIGQIYRSHKDGYPRKLERCCLPRELENFSAYDIDGYHENFGIGMKYLNSDIFRQIYYEYTEISGKGSSAHFIEDAVRNEKCALEIKHMIFEMLLCHGMDNVGVTALFLSDDAVSSEIDLGRYCIKRLNLWEFRINDLLSLGKETILMIYK